MSDKRQNSGQTPADAAALRKRAEEQARAMEPTALSAQTPEEIQRVFHELWVHQIELEMQNEELRTAQAELEASQARYFDLYDLAPVGYCTLSEQGLILEANLTAATLLGVARSALVRQLLTRFILPQDQDIYYLHRKQLFETSEPQLCELRMVRQGGNPFWVRLEAIVAQDAERGAPVCRVVVSDITDRKRAEDTMQEHATQLALLNEIGSQVAALLDVDQVLDRAAHLVQKLFGYHHVGLFTRAAGEERLVMRARAGEFAPLFPPDHSLALGQGLVGWVGQHGETLLANDVDAEPHYVNPYPNRLPTRSELSVPIRIGDEIVGVLDVQSPRPNAFDPDDVATLETLADQLAVAINNARLYQAIQQELGERLRSEAELRRLKEFNESIVQSMTEGIIVEDAARSLTFVNPAAAAMLGYAPGELVDQHWTYIIPPDQQPLVQAADARRAQGQTDHYEVDLVRRDGRRFPVLISATPRLAPEDGRFSGMLAVVTDLSELKRLEAQFRQAQKMEAVGRLAGGVAHDFNNLLAVIHLSTRLLEKKLHTEDPLRTHVERIQKASRQAANLTKQLLAFSRKEIIEPKVLDLNDLLGELAKMLCRLISEDIELTTHLADDLWLVKIDPTQVEQVVVNLAVNARDAMPTGGRLTLETAKVTLDAAYAAGHLGVQPGEYVLLAVSDTGVGMDDEVKARLFEPFFTTKERGKGTGLGLATVFGIVKQNGGHIGVYSEVGQGTTFKIYLPRVSEGVLAPAPPVPRPAARGSETLLLVEDEPMLQEIVRDTLQDQGYRVLTASDGVEALQVAETHEGPIHLLLTDVVMPRLSGWALADRLRPRRPEMRVLYASGYTDSVILHHGVLHEDVHLLSKPFEPEALAQKVRDVLDATKRPAAEGEKEETP